MAQFKDSNPFEEVPENTFPLQPGISELIDEYIKIELINGVEQIAKKISKALSTMERSVTLYTISAQGLMKYYKTAYSYCCSELLCSMLSDITTKELLKHTEENEIYKEIYEELLKKNFRLYFKYDNFMDLRSIDIIVIIK